LIFKPSLLQSVRLDTRRVSSVLQQCRSVARGPSNPIST
jgi:hypothetical protein